MEKEVFNTREAAEYLGLTPFTIRKLVKEGGLPARKVGKDWRFYKPDLVAWLRSGQGANETQKKA